jgi:hypothetical protein
MTIDKLQRNPRPFDRLTRRILHSLNIDFLVTLSITQQLCPEFKWIDATLLTAKPILVIVVSPEIIGMVVCYLW